MIIGIQVNEKDFVNMSDLERLHLLDEAFFKSKQLKLKAEAYEKRLMILPRKPEEVLTQKEYQYVQALRCGLFD